MASFPKQERLCRQKTIAQLFAGKGNSFARHPVRIVWKVVEELPEAVPFQVAFSVAKKNIKRANRRNLLKRRLREAWRAHKEELASHLAEQGARVAFMIIYQGKEEADYQTIESKMAECVRFFRLKIKLGENSA